MGDCQSVPQEDNELQVSKERVQVIIPEGVAAGSQIKFRTPDGRLIQVVIPEGFGPGDKITVEVPPKKVQENKFKTLHEAFVYLDPKHTGYITDRDRFAEVASMLTDLKRTKEEVWKSLDKDGNGQVNWPEFVEWAEDNCSEPLELGLSGSESAVSFPALWTGPTDKPSDYVAQLQVTDTKQFMELGELVQKTYKKIWTRDRKKTGVDKVPSGFDLIKAMRCENLKDWKRYYHRRHQIAHACSQKTNFVKRPVLTSRAAALYKRQAIRTHCNEWLLFHGTSPESAKSILSGTGDFVISLAGSATGTLYGRGTYFAESITKADEYAQADEDGLCCVLVCKVAAGHVLYNNEVTPDAEKLQQSCISGEHHSILGDREKCRRTFKEIVIFDADQVYVEYALFYKRQYA